jgi:hypothetical protein
MTWDPFGTLGRALWIGGGQWSGKSTVSNLLAQRHGLTAYHYDYHDARGHNDRRIACGRPLGDIWSMPDPEAMAAVALEDFRLRFEWVLDDLRALVSGRPILAEGWGLRPELVAPLLEDVRRMVVMVPTERWRRHQLEVLPRATTFGLPVADPVKAQRDRVERDRILSAEAAGSARRLGIPVIEVDGSLDAARIADVVTAHFAPFL